MSRNEQGVNSERVERRVENRFAAGLALSFETV